MARLICIILAIFAFASSCYAGEVNQEKPIIGIATIATLSPNAKFDVKFIKNDSYTIDQYVRDYRINDLYNQPIINKYTSRILTPEVTDLLTNYFKTEYNKNKQITNQTFTAVAEKYKYDYLFLSVVNFNRIERVTGSAFFTLQMQIYWQIDSTANFYLYDTKSNQIIFSKSIKKTQQTQFPAGSWFYSVSESAPDDAMRLGLNKISSAAINDIIDNIPSLPK